MRVRIARKIIKGLVTLLILNASLATNVSVSATSSTLLSKQQQSETAPARRERAQTVPDPKEWRGITRFAGALRNDPFNPLQFAERSNEFNPYEVTFASAVELPSAEPQSWSVVRPTVPTGRVQRDKFTSKVLGNERPIWIYTPHGYSAD